MMGRRPYDGRSRREIRNQILAKQAYVRPDMVPKGWSLEAVDFTNKLIQRKPYKRLGKQGIQELKKHSWFNDFDWTALENKSMKPPFVPNIKNVFEYLRNLTEDFTEADSSMENSLLVRRNSFQELFNGYDCFPSRRAPPATAGNAKSSKVTEPGRDETRLESKDAKKLGESGGTGGKKTEEKGFKKTGVPRTGSRRQKSRKEAPQKVMHAESLGSKKVSKTLKKNSRVGSDLTINQEELQKLKMKNLAKKTLKQEKGKENASDHRGVRTKSKMGVLGTPAHKMASYNVQEKSKNVRHVIKKKSALNRSLRRQSKDALGSKSRGENRVNQSLNPGLQENPLMKSKSRAGKQKGDLKGYLSLNSKHFYDTAKKSRDKRKVNLSLKKNSKLLKGKNLRKQPLGRGYYISPQYDRKRDSKGGVFMSSLNYSRLNGKRGAKFNSFSKLSRRSKDQIQESFGGAEMYRPDLQESLRKASFHGTFFEKMRKFGKRRLEQGRASDGKKNISIYLSHNSNNLRKKRLRSHKGQPHYFNSGQFLWNKRRKLPGGLNLTLARRGAFQEAGQGTSVLDNPKLGRGSFRTSKQGFSKGDIYRQLDEFDRMKNQRLEPDPRTLHSRGSRKGSAFRKKGDLIREIAEITQSLSCTSNLKKLTSKLQNKENAKQREKLSRTSALRGGEAGLLPTRKRSQKFPRKRQDLTVLNPNLGLSRSGLN